MIWEYDQLVLADKELQRWLGILAPTTGNKGAKNLMTPKHCIVEYTMCKPGLGQLQDDQKPLCVMQAHVRLKVKSHVLPFTAQVRVNATALCVPCCRASEMHFIRMAMKILRRAFVICDRI